MQYTLSLLALASTAVAMPGLTAPKGHQYIAPGPGDSRGPCPGLNSLANHGFLPRNGKDITVADYVKACKDGLNVGPSFSIPIGLVAMQSNCTTATQMDLEQLKHHDVLIEHDGSLSRQDLYFGPDYPLNQRSYEMFLAPFKGHKETTMALASAAKFGRVNDSLTNNPKVSYGPRELVLSYGETALYLMTMGRSLTSGIAPLNFIESLFAERLPYELGWKPDGPEVTLPAIGAMAVMLQGAGPSPGDEAIYTLTSGTYESLLEGKLILGTELKAATCPK